MAFTPAATDLSAKSSPAITGPNSSSTPMSQSGHGETNSARAYAVRSNAVSRPYGGGTSRQIGWASTLLPSRGGVILRQSRNEIRHANKADLIRTVATTDIRLDGLCCRETR